MKILIADDDALSSRLMQKTLERSGYEIVVVPDGRAAAEELARADSPRLALLDWMMPGMDGPEVCRAVRSRGGDRYIYILLLTSKQTTEDMVEGLQAGADDYLTKPFKLAELNARLMTGQRILQLEEKLVQAREAMRFRATHDSLTGLLNRAAVLTRVEHALDRLRTDDVPFSLLLCDVDHFKKVNDIYGHHAGDAVLQEVAARLLQSVEGLGSIARYGGEEFLIKLRNCGPQQLPARAEAVRKVLQSRPVEIPGGQLAITVSLGAVAVTSDLLHMRLDDILQCADQALYKAKSDGRNCVRIAGGFSSDLVTPTPSYYDPFGMPHGAEAALAGLMRSTKLHRPASAELLDTAKVA